MQDNSSIKQLHPQKTPTTDEPVAARTRAQQKSNSDFGTRSKTRGAMLLAVALAAASNFVGDECSPRRLAGRVLPSVTFETVTAVMDGKTGEMLKY